MSETDDLGSMLRGVASAPARQPPPKIGDRLGSRYLVEALVGEGGMGTVYRARDEKLGEAVALKLVHAGFDVLRDEVRLAQKVTHPNVCRTFDLEEVDGHQLVKMEYVAGETLAVRLRRETRLPIDEAIRIARAICDGLAAAHAKQIVHGDLKPANVMLDGQRVVLMDFGIARLAATPADGLRGTRGYMAPEQLRGQTVEVRADLYALGCVAFEMLAGEPFGTDPDVRAKRPDTPRWLARAIASLLATNPADRSAGLARLRSGPRSRTRVVVPVVLVAVIAGVISWRATRTPPWVAKVEDFKEFEENGNDALSFSPDGAWIAFMSDRADHVREQPYLMSSSLGGETIPVSMPAHPDSLIFDVRWDREGSSLLLAANSNETEPHLFRQPVAGSPPQPVGPPTDLGPGGGGVEDCGDGIVYTRFGMDGMRLFLGTAGGKRTLLFKSQAGEFISAPHCDRSGQQIAIVIGRAYAGGDGDVFLIDRAGTRRQLTTDHRSAAVTFAGSTLVVAQTQDGKTQLFELPLSGGHARRLVVDTDNDTAPEVSRDGRYLTFMRDNTSFLPVISAPAGPDGRDLTSESGTFWFPIAITDRLIVTQHMNGANWDVATVQVDGGATHVLARGKHPFPALDHERVYFTDEDEQRLYSIALDGGTPALVATSDGPIMFGNEGVDGIHLLVQRGGEFAGFHVGTGKILEPDGVNGFVSVAPGGWRAATMIASNHFSEPVDLLLVPPGASFDHPQYTLHALTVQNRWLDEHRIFYCTRGDEHLECYVFDVTTGTATRIAAESPQIGDMMAALMPDNMHVLDVRGVGKITRHIVRNFGDR